MQIPSLDTHLKFAQICTLRVMITMYLDSSALSGSDFFILVTTQLNNPLHFPANHLKAISLSRSLSVSENTPLIGKGFFFRT